MPVLVLNTLMQMLLQQDLHYLNTFMPAESQKCSDRWIYSDEWSPLIYVQSYVELL